MLQKTVQTPEGPPGIARCGVVGGSWILWNRVWPWEEKRRVREIREDRNAENDHLKKIIKKIYQTSIHEFKSFCDLCKKGSSCKKGS